MLGSMIQGNRPLANFTLIAPIAIQQAAGPSKQSETVELAEMRSQVRKLKQQMALMQEQLSYQQRSYQNWIMCSYCGGAGHQEFECLEKEGDLLCYAQQQDDPEIYPVNAAEGEANELKAKIEALEIQNGRFARLVYPDFPESEPKLDVAEANAIYPEVKKTGSNQGCALNEISFNETGRLTGFFVQRRPLNE